MMAGSAPGQVGVQRRSFITHLRPIYVYERAARVAHTLCLGGLSFLFSLFAVVSGVVLMFQYLPGTGYANVAGITWILPFGRVIRSVHYWASQLMVLSVFGHLGRVFYTRSYQRPRELNWLVGVGLLVVSVILDFTGYLLRGNQETQAAASVAANLLRLVPAAGAALGRIFLGPAANAGSSSASLAVYAWHCAGLPLALGTLVALHFWRIRKDGITRPL